MFLQIANRQAVVNILAVNTKQYVQRSQKNTYSSLNKKAQ